MGMSLCSRLRIEFHEPELGMYVMESSRECMRGMVCIAGSWRSSRTKLDGEVMDLSPSLLTNSMKSLTSNYSALDFQSVSTARISMLARVSICTCISFFPSWSLVFAALPSLPPLRTLSDNLVVSENERWWEETVLCQPRCQLTEMHFVVLVRGREGHYGQQIRWGREARSGAVVGTTGHQVRRPSLMITRAGSLVAKAAGLPFPTGSQQQVLEQKTLKPCSQLLDSAKWCRK